MNDAEKFLQHINDNYNILKSKYRKFCIEKHYDWDEDIFSDTILKCYDTIVKNDGLVDNSPYGMESYFFRSFKQNLQREKQYCRVAKRDMNVSSDDVMELYEDYCNEHKDSSTKKLKSDLYKDFSALYLMLQVEKAFDDEHQHLFKLKTFIPNMTYKRLQQTTGCKSCRQKVIDVRNWLRENVTKDEVNKAFLKVYGNLL